MRRIGLWLIILIPVCVLLAVAGGGLYLVIYKPLGDFVERSIRDTLSWMSDGVRDYADRELDKLRIAGDDSDEKAVRRAQVDALMAIESFARGKEIAVVIRRPDKIPFITGSNDDVEVLMERIGRDREGFLTLPEGRTYFASRDFVPWNWRITLVKNSSTYSPMVARARFFYLMTALVAFAIAVLLVAYLSRTIAWPINRIIRDLEEGTPPSHEGIREFEILADAIAEMMGSLKEQRRHLTAALENMSDGMAVFDADLQLVLWNSQFLKLNSYPVGFIRLKQSFTDVIRYNIERGDYGPGDPEIQLAERVRRAQEGGSVRLEIHRADDRWLEMNRNPMPGGGFVTTYNDITERKRAEAELTRHRDHLEELVGLRTDDLMQANQRLEEARVRLHDAIESSPGAFSLFDAQDRLAVFNRRYTRLYPGLEALVVPGASFESIIKAAVERGIPLDANGQSEAWLSERVRQHREPSDSLIRRRNDGRWLQIDERKTEEGGIVAWYTDITERKRSEDKLRELNQLKNRYLGMAAHDLRNPLSSIRGMSHMLVEDELPEDVTLSFLDSIYNESNEMLILVNDLLDVSVIESDKLELRLTEKNMAKLLAERVKLIAISAEKMQIEITTDIQEVPDCLLDASRLRQVLDNLLTNALKFSASGTTLHVACRSTQCGLEVSVTDQGQGIERKRIDNLFKPFKQSASQPKHGEKSHGLGLFIVKSIVDAHRGEINVLSEVGKGTKIVVRIPTSLHRDEDAVC